MPTTMIPGWFVFYQVLHWFTQSYCGGLTVPRVRRSYLPTTETPTLPPMPVAETPESKVIFLKAQRGSSALASTKR